MKSTPGEDQVLTRKELGALARGLKRKIQSGVGVTDDIFDHIFSPEVRNFSTVHWTPMAVALKAAEVLKQFKIENFLDVGSGCGKFCILNALMSEMQITGVEQRAFLSQAAKKAKNAFELPQLTFVEGNAFDLDWKEFDCIYFYNPFCEQKFPERRMRNDILFQPSLYDAHVQMSLSRLRDQKKGSRVLTYHGLGTELPDDYSLQYYKAVGSDFLKLWVKTS